MEKPEELNIPQEQVLRLREKIKQAAEKFVKEWVENDHEAEVDYDQHPSFFDFLEQRRKFQPDKLVKTPDNFRANGKRKVIFKAFQIKGKFIEGDDFKPKEGGYRYATAQELAALMKINPEIFEGQKIIALGSSVTDEGEEYESQKDYSIPAQTFFPMLYTDRKELSYSNPTAGPGYEEHPKYVESAVTLWDLNNRVLQSEQTAYLLAVKEELG